MDEIRVRGTLLAGRLLHGYAFSFTANHVFGGSAGIALTFVALMASALLGVWMGLGPR